MKKAFIQNLLLLQILNLIIKPVWLLVVDRMAQNILGEVYGQYYLVLNFTLLANIFLDLGIQNFNNTSIASDLGFFKRYFKSIFLIKSVLSSIYIVAVVSIGLSSGMPSDLLWILVANQVLITFILYLRTNINGLHHYKIDSLLSVSDKFFSIILCLVFYYIGYISITYFVLAQLIASCITFLIAITINIRLWKQLTSLPTEETKDNLLHLIRQSLPYALLFTLMNFYTRMDVTMMNWLLPDAVYHGGLYAQSFRLLDAAAMFAMLFAGLLLPMFARMITTLEDVRPLAKLATTILMIISLTVGSATLLFSEEILAGLYQFPNTNQLTESSKVFINIMLTFIPMSLTFVFSTLLTAKKDIHFMNIFALAAFVCNFAINYLLIPDYKSFGASIGSLITQSVFAFLCIWRCFKLFDFQLDWSLIMKFVSLIFLLTGFHFFIKPLDNVWFKLTLFASAAGVFSIMIGLVQLKKIGQIFDKTPQ